MLMNCVPKTTKTDEFKGYREKSKRENEQDRQCLQNRKM